MFNQTVNSTTDYWFAQGNFGSRVVVKHLNPNRFGKLYTYTTCGIVRDSIIGIDSSDCRIFQIPNFTPNLKYRLANFNGEEQNFQLLSPNSCNHFIYVSNPESPAPNGYYCISSPLTFMFTCDDRVGLQGGTYNRVRWFITGPNGFSTQIGFTNQLTPNYPLVYTFPAAGTYTINFAFDVYTSSTNTWVNATQPNQTSISVNIAPTFPPFNLSASNLNPCPGELVTLFANLPAGFIPPNLNICWSAGGLELTGWPFNTACTGLFNNQHQTISNLNFDINGNTPTPITVTFNNSCEVQKIITITPRTNFVNIVANRNCNFKVNYSANFSPCSSLNYSFNWSFPGGSPATSTLANPLVTYPGTGNYAASLTVTHIPSGNQYGPFTISNVNPQLNPNNVQPPLLAINGVLSNQNPLECNANNNVYAITNASSFPGFTFTISGVTNGTHLGGNGSAAVIQWDNNPSTQSSFVVTATSPDGCVTSQIIELYACCGTLESQFFINGGNISTWLAANNITTNTISTGNNILLINGTVNIDQHLTFSGCQNVLFGPNAKLDLQNNVTLTVTNSSLRSCADYLWDGIYANHTSENIVVNNSEFFDAKNAIFLSSNANYNIINGRFYNNWVGIAMANMTTQSTAIRKSIFKNTYLMKRALGSPALLPTIAYQGFANAMNKGTGIYLTSCQNTQIGDGTAANLRNEFNDLNFGVFALRSDVRLYNNKFININNNATINNMILPASVRLVASTFAPRVMLIGSQLPNHGNEFTNCHYGVYASESVRGEIIGNEFNNCSVAGIFWQLCRSGKNRILHNELNTQRRYGIYLNNNPGAAFDVNDNKITCVQSSSIYTNTFGIVADVAFGNTDAQQYTIRRNDVNDAGFGIKITNAIRATIEENRVSNYPATTIPSFITNYEIAGIQLSNCTNARIFSNLVLGNDANNFRVKGIEIQECNRPWLQCDSVQTCGFAYAIRGVNSNAYILRCSAANSAFGYVYYNGGVTGPQGSASIVNGNKWWNVPNHTLAAGTPPTNGSLSRWFLPGINTNTAENPNPGMVNTFTFLNTQIPNTQNSTFGYATNICNVVDYPFFRVAQETNWLNKVVQDTAFINGFDSHTRYLLEQQAFEALKNNPDYSINEPALAAYYEEKSQSNSGKFETIADSINSKGELSEYEKAMLAALIASIVPEREQEANLKTVTDIYLNTFAVGIDSLSNADINTLHSIAQVCYFQGGKAVLLARSMLNSLPNTIPNLYADSCIATYGMQRQAKPIENKSAIKIYPTLLEKGQALTVENGNGYTVRFVNLMGNVLLEQNITETKVNVTIPSQVGAGLYIVKLINPLGKTSSQKIIIH